MTVPILPSPDRADPGPGLARLVAAGPVVRMKVPVVGTMTFLTTHAACEAMLKDEALFSTDVASGRNRRVAWLLRLMPRNVRVMTANMLQKDGAEHRRLRRTVDGAFRRSAVEAWRPRIEAIAGTLLDDWAASEDGDFVRHVARPLPLAVICEILGLPQADRPAFIRWMGALAGGSTLRGLPKLYVSLTRISRYLMARFAERRRDPGDDLISALVRAADGEDALTDDEVLAMLGLLFIAGHETTTHLIGNSVLALLENPEQRDRLIADPALEGRAMDELLRHTGSVEMTKPRYLRRDAVFMGVPFRRGEAVMAHLAAANRDPAVFDDPDRLDLGREGNRHLALGGGPHFCLGAWLAKAELGIVLRLLFARAPGVALAVPEAELRWRALSGMRALERLPLTRTARAGM